MPDRPLADNQGVSTRAGQVEPMHLEKAKGGARHDATCRGHGSKKTRAARSSAKQEGGTGGKPTSSPTPDGYPDAEAS